MPATVIVNEADWLTAVAGAHGRPAELRAVLRRFRGRPTVAAVPVLSAALRVDDVVLQRAVIDLLAQVPGPAADEAIASVLEWADGLTVGLAVRRLGRRGARSALPALLDCAERRGPSLGEPGRSLVLVFVARFADSRALGVLHDGVTDRKSSVRQASAGALKHIGTYKSREELERAVQELPWWQGRFARRALRDLRGSGSS